MTWLIQLAVQALRAFYQEWRARRDIQLLERSKLTVQATKKSVRAWKKLREIEREGDALLKRLRARSEPNPFFLRRKRKPKQPPGS